MTENAQGILQKMRFDGKIFENPIAKFHRIWYISMLGYWMPNEFMNHKSKE